MIENGEHIPNDAARAAAVRRTPLLPITPWDQLKAQIDSAHALYGNVDMKAGEVAPAPVAKLTKKERRLAQEAMFRPIF